MTTAPAPTQDVADAPRGNVDRKLRRAHGRERTFINMRGLCQLLTWIVCILLVTFGIDWLVTLPPIARIVLLSINGLLILGVIWHYWMRHLRRFDPVRTSLQVERAYPQLSSVLISYVQFAESADDPHATTSPSLLRAVRRQAQEQTASLDFGRIVDFSQLQKLLLITMLALTVTLGVGAMWPAHVQVLIARMTNPFSLQTYPTRTKVDPATITGDVTVQQGESVAISAAAAGMVPQQGAIMVRTAEGSWERVGVARGDNDVFLHEFASVHQSFDYQIRIGDYRSPEYNVTVVPPPQIVNVEVDQQYPAYTNRGREETDSLNMQVPQGTTLTWRVEFDRPLKSIRMIDVPRGRAVTTDPDEDEQTDEPQDLTEAELDASGKVLTARYTAEESFNYRLTFTDADHSYSYDPQVQHYVHVTPDAAPDAEITSPSDLQQIGTLNKKIALEYRVSDDYGLNTVSIAYSINDNEEQKLELDVFDNERIVEGRYLWDVTQTIRGLSQGDVVTYAIEVTDNHAGPDGPNVGRSIAHSLTIVSIAEYQQYIYEKISALGAELETVHEIEKEGAEAVEEIKEQNP